MNKHRKKFISLIISAITTSSSVVYASTIIDNDIISVQDGSGVFNKKGQYEINNTQINVSVTASGNVSGSHGILVNANPGENLNTTTTVVRNSVITSEGSGAYLVGGYAQFDNTKIQSTGNYGIVTKGGNIDILNGSSIEGKNNAYGLYLTKGYDGTYVENTVNVDNSSINSEAESAIVVGSSATAHININNNSTVTSGANKLLNAADNAIVDFNLNGSTANGSMTASDTAIVDVTLADASSLTGSAQNINSINIDSGSSWTVLTDSDVNDLKNEGVVTLSDQKSIGSVLTIHNNYKGNDGTIVFNSRLAGDDSVTDKLVIEGNTEGNTNVIINNIGGQGAQTIEGIGLIYVDGQSDGTFTQAGRIVAGAYDYSLVRGDEDSNNWYLTSQIQTGPQPPVSHEHVNRPEGGAYSANIASAMTLFENNLSDRQGTFYIDPVTGKKEYTSLWLHQVGGHTRAKDTSGQLKTTSNRYSVMLGGDIGSGSGNSGSWRIGALTGYGNSHNSTTSRVTGYDAKGDVKGYTTGLYGTWYADGSDQHGFYIDTLVQYSWFDNTAEGDEISRESYKSEGLSASVETGYVFPVYQGSRTDFYLRPQAQIIWSDISADDHTEKNGTIITDNTNGNIRTKVGIKAFAEGHPASGDNISRSVFKPFVETNWIHNTQNYGVSMDGVNITQSGTKNIAEVKLGLEGDLSSRLRLTGNVGVQAGDDGWSDTSVALGIRYSF